MIHGEVIIDGDGDCSQLIVCPQADITGPDFGRPYTIRHLKLRGVDHPQTSLLLTASIRRNTQEKSE
jgi:hypothetical protein